MHSGLPTRQELRYEELNLSMPTLRQSRAVALHRSGPGAQKDTLMVTWLVEKELGREPWLQAGFLFFCEPRASRKIELSFNSIQWTSAKNLPKAPQGLVLEILVFP